ncbi:hypothetical protein [Dictyobacter formicarum]|uniref:HEAT repeat domain-containing protein n=1 Tax=Dictyobacter formicarum TaxID=2778368 RepID=A0ABQ3VU31_9CHLR|nr:hypothetical protein [Dictyobacter formicarum]GHO89139.1 hypothetical protein KSZ_71450 [Dictyobacter formicarum]
MTEEDIEQEVTFFRQAILEAIARIDPRFSWSPEVPEWYRRIERLAQEDRRHFRMLSAKLLQDENHEVCVGAILLLSSLGIKDNVLSLDLVGIAMKQKALRKEAIEALWGIYTYAVLPQLFLFA